MDQRRAKMAGALIDGKTSDEVKKLTAEYAQASAELTKIQADAFSKIWTMLKPNQQGKGDQAYELLAQMFTQPGGRGRGGMARGRGQGR